MKRVTKSISVFFLCLMASSFCERDALAEEIRGKYCYTCLKSGSLVIGKDISYALALREAVKENTEFKALLETVDDCALKKSVLEITAGCCVKHVKVVKQSLQERKACTELIADLDMDVVKSVISRKIKDLKSSEIEGFDGVISNEQVRIINYKREGSFVTILYQAKEDLLYESFGMSITSYDINGRRIVRNAGRFPLGSLSRGKVRWASLPVPADAASFELELE